MNLQTEPPLERPSQNPTNSTSELSDEVYQLRKKILSGIIDESATLIDIQSSTNRSFRARTCPCAALSLEEATLYHLTRK